MTEENWNCLPDGAQPPRLIVCERRGQWAVALRRELASCSVRVYETRSLTECRQRVAQCPSSFVVMELAAASADGMAEDVALLLREFPLARLAVVASRKLAAYETLMREAGATHFTTSPRESGVLAGLACRHLDTAAHPKHTVTQRIWESLPWG